MAFSFLTTVDHFQCLFWSFWTQNRYTLPCLFVNRVQKRKRYVSEISLTSKNISATYFVICLSLHMFSLPFWGIFILKSMNHIYLLSVYTLNTPNTRISLFITAKKVTFFFYAVVWWLLPSKYVISDTFCNLTCNCISATCLLVFSPRQTSFLFCF